MSRAAAAKMVDPRVIVGICGITLSIFMHELFHVIMHFGEIQAINAFPDSHAIIEILFKPSRDYDILVEEALAYAVTMVTLVLTIMLIHDLEDARDSRTVHQVIEKDFHTLINDRGQQETLDHLKKILGITAHSVK